MNSHQTALITGASGGIGAEIARVLAARQIDLILVARREAHLIALQQELQERHGVTVHVMAIDLSRKEAPQALYDRVQEAKLTVDILVNNAGVGMRKNFLTISLAEYDNMMMLNMMTLTMLTHLFGADMKRRGWGHILQISSVAAFQAIPHFAVYAATKAYVLSLSEALAREFKEFGVTVTTLCPGSTQTEFFSSWEKQPKNISQGFAMLARPVAEAAVRGLFQRKVIVVPGLWNKISTSFMRLLPRSWAVALAGLVMKHA